MCKTRDFILNTDGQEFKVSFIKRTTGKERVMRCFLNKNDCLKEIIERDIINNLIRVYDVEKEGYRCISLEGVKWIECGDETFVPEQELVTEEE